MEVINLKKEKVDLSLIKNTRFMYNPKTKELILDDYNCGMIGTHSELYYKAKNTNKGFDDYIRGWIGFGGGYKNGIIHFAPPVDKTDYERIDAGLSFIEQMIKCGANDKIKIRNFGIMGEIRYKDLISNKMLSENYVDNRSKLVKFKAWQYGSYIKQPLYKIDENMYTTNEWLARIKYKKLIKEYLRIENPYIVKGKLTESLQTLKNKGFDGIVKNDTYIVFDKSQVKSINEADAKRDNKVRKNLKNIFVDILHNIKEGVYDNVKGSEHGFGLYINISDLVKKYFPKYNKDDLIIMLGERQTRLNGSYNYKNNIIKLNCIPLNLLSELALLHTSNKQKMIDYIKGRVYTYFISMEDTFVHEMTHALDNSRYKNNDKIESARKKNNRTKSYKEYMSTPAEFNAWFTGVLADNEEILEDIFWKKDNWKEFYSYIIQKFDFVKYLDEKYRRKFDKRIYQYWKYNIKPRKYEDFKKIPESVQINERLFPELNDRQYNRLLNYTTDNGKANAYTKWFGLHYNDIPKDYLFGIDNTVTIGDLTKTHSKLRQAGKVKPITDYKNFTELQMDIINNKEYKSNREKDSKIKEGAKKLTDINGYTIYDIKTYESAQKYGKNTKWCVTDILSDTNFNKYVWKVDEHNFGKLLYAIRNDEKYGISITKMIKNNWVVSDISIFDELDKKVAHWGYISKSDLSEFNYDEIIGYEIPLFKNIIDYCIKQYKLSVKDIENTISETIHYANQWKNKMGEDVLFIIEKNPTKKEFWKLLNNSVSNELRGIVGLQEDSDLFVWDSYYGTHTNVYKDSIYPTYKKFDDKGYIEVYFDKNGIRVQGLFADINKLKEKYYNSNVKVNKVSHKLKDIFADDELGLLEQQTWDNMTTSEQEKQKNTLVRRKQLVKQITELFIDELKKIGIVVSTPRYSINRNLGISYYFEVEDASTEVRISDHTKNVMFNTSQINIIVSDDMDKNIEEINDWVKKIAQYHEENNKFNNDIDDVCKSLTDEFIIDWIKIRYKGKDFKKPKYSSQSSFDIALKELAKKYGYNYYHIRDGRFEEYIRKIISDNGGRKHYYDLMDKGE